MIAINEDIRDFYILQAGKTVAKDKANNIIDAYIKKYPSLRIFLETLKTDINNEEISKDELKENINKGVFVMSEKLKIKADFREAKSEKNPELRGFADLALGGYVIKGVAVKERTTDKGTIINFDLPQRKYEQDGEVKYAKEVEISNKDEKIEKSIVREIRLALKDAMAQENVNEYGKKSVERTTNIPYSPDYVSAFAKSATSEKQPELRGFADIYVGGILKINDIAIKEFQNKETKETFDTIQFPQMKVVKGEETTYKDRVYPIVNGLRSKIQSTVVESLNKELAKDEQATEPVKPELEEDEEQTI